MINNQRLLATFLDYILIDSESTHAKFFALRLAADLEAIGCQVEWDNSQNLTGSDTGNLYCTLPGTIEGEGLVFSAHMDTVVPGQGIVPVIEDGVIRSKGDTVLGGDDKSGVAAIVEAFRTVTEQKIPHPTVQAVFTVCEETGLRGSRNLDYSKLVARRALVLDSSGDAGVIITAAPGQYKVGATVVGRRAHAGVAPEQGISAIQVLSEAIAQMKLLRIDSETTANIGAVSASYATNIVPERASMVGEARSRSDEKLEAQVAHMVDCLQRACDKYGARLEPDVSFAYSAYSHSPEHPLVMQVSEAARKAGLTPVLKASGGGSDANHFNKAGVDALVLGTGMAKVHTTEEELTIDNLQGTARLVLQLIQG